MNRKGISRLEIIAIVLLVAVLAALFLASVVSKRKVMHRAARAACVNNLKQVGNALNLYASENREVYPPIDNTKNNFIFEANLLYPEYLTDPMMAMCPGDPRWDSDSNFRLIADHSVDGTPKGQVHPDCFTGDSYVYLGWMVMSDKEAEAFFGAYEKLMPHDYHDNIIVSEGWGNAEGNAIYRLFANVDRYLITDINSSGKEPLRAVPILWDRPHTDSAKFSHQPAGGNILYLDGHVDYQIFDDRFSPRIDYHIYGPINSTTARLLDERPREPIPDCE